jgi:HSP20 family molecular chaperone IbpA
MFPWNTLFSSHKNQNSFLKNLQQNDVQSFIEKVFEEAMPKNIQETMNQTAPVQGQFQQAQAHPLNAAVLETHSFIYIRIPIEDENWLKKMKILHTSNQSIIRGIPNEDDKHVIPLPALVRKKGTTVQYKDDVLEIRLLKQSEMHYSEIDISEL